MGIFLTGVIHCNYKIIIMRIQLVAAMHLIACTTLHGREGIPVSMFLYQEPATYSKDYSFLIVHFRNLDMVGAQNFNKFYFSIFFIYRIPVDNMGILKS